MYGHWKLVVADAEDITPDGGSILGLRLTHLATGISISANIVEYEGDPRIVDELTWQGWQLPSPVAKRLIGKLYDHYGVGVTNEPASWRVRSIVLSDCIDDCYADDKEAQAVKSLIQACLDQLTSPLHSGGGAA